MRASGQPSGMSNDDWLGLTPLEDGRSHLVLSAPLVRFDAKLYGGTGLALTVAAMEAQSGRDALWATVQFVGVADEGDRLDIHVEELASGGTTSQLRLTATCGERLVLASLGATARVRPDGFAARFHTMPETPGPEGAPPLRFGDFDPTPQMLAKGPFATSEFRVVDGADGARYVWVRINDWPLTRAGLAYIADFVPSAVLHAAGRLGGGTSLDNTIRYGATVSADSPWILVDSDPYFADNGYVHGAARLWSHDGTLLAVASQSAVARIFD